MDFKDFKHLIITSVAILVLAASFSTGHAAGTVVGWGQNGSSQATNAGALLNIQAIAAGSDDTSPSIGFSLGLKLDGTIIGWGNNTYLQTSFPTLTNSYFVAIAAGEYHGLGLSADGKVYAWGGNFSHQTNVPSILSSNVTAIAAGSSGTDVNGNPGTHSLALKNDGTVVSWGKNNFGQTNVPANLANVIAIAAGSSHSLALKSDGTVVAWGNNGNLQTNVPPSATNVVAIAAGSFHSLALKTNGTVVAWGYNGFGQTAVPPSASNVVAIAAGDEHSMALRRDGTVVVWGTPNQYTFAVPPSATNNVSAIASAGRHALAIVGDGTPAITVPPRNQSVYPGGKVVFIVMAAGPGNLTYQWQTNSVNIPGATGPMLVLTNVQPANSGSYQVTVRNSYGIATASAGLTLQDGRVNITQQPASTTSVNANSNTTVSVTAVGAIPLYFQWWQDGNPIPNATNFSYTITNAQTANAGGYSVTVSNAYDTVMSSTDTVSVIYYPPSFLTQPIGTNVPVGGAFQLSASVTGSSPFGWQWRTNLTPIPGATSTNYIVPSAQLSDAWSYDVVVTNSAGSTNSSAAIVNVGYAPVVVQPPLSVNNNAGDTVNFSCLVTGTPPISFQWTLNGYPITSQTNSSLALTNVQSANIGFYALMATNIFGSATSSNAALNLNGFNFSQWAGLEAYYPLDNGIANDASGNGNDGTNFGAVAASDRFGNTNSAMSFDGNGHYIQCKTGTYFGSNYTVSAWVNPIAYNTYSRIMDFGDGSPYQNTDMALTSANSGLPYFEAYIAGTQVGDVGSPSVIPLNNWTQVVGTCNGTQIRLYFNGVLLVTANCNVNRQPSPTFFNYLGKSNWANDKYFYGSFDDIRLFDRTLSPSDVAQLYALEADVPVITQQPQAQTVDAGSTVSFSVTATANHPLTYQWRTNDVPLPGATNAVLTLSNVQSANIGFYSVAVSNSVTGVVSAGALLNLTGAADPTANGLVAYYPFNGNVQDASGNGYDGTNYNVSMGTDRFGVGSAAGQFNGSSSHVILPSALVNLMSGTNPMSISTWVETSPAVTNTGNKSIVDIGAPSPNRMFGTLMLSGNFYYSEWAGIYGLSSGIPIGDNSWHHCVASFDGVNLSLYVDGVFRNALPVIANRLNTIGTIGVRGDLVAEFWNGGIDDVRVYNRALSSDEVAYLYALESHSTVPSVPTLAASFSSGTALNLNLAGGLPGSNYVLQAATNLTPPIQWQSLVTNSADTKGVSQFSDTNLNSAQKFYRLTTP